MHLFNGTIVVLSMLVSTTTAHAERRCGWLDNPATGKWTLYDAQGEWQIMFTGGGFRPAEGMDKIPDLTLKEYVHTFAIHGYACACMDVDTEKERSRGFIPFDNCRFQDAIRIRRSNTSWKMNEDKCLVHEQQRWGSGLCLIDRKVL